MHYQRNNVYAYTAVNLSTFKTHKIQSRNMSYKNNNNHKAIDTSTKDIHVNILQHDEIMSTALLLHTEWTGGKHLQQ